MKSKLVSDALIRASRFAFVHFEIVYQRVEKYRLDRLAARKEDGESQDPVKQQRWLDEWDTPLRGVPPDMIPDALTSQFYRAIRIRDDNSSAFAEDDLIIQNISGQDLEDYRECLIRLRNAAHEDDTLDIPRAIARLAESVHGTVTTV